MKKTLKYKTNYIFGFLLAVVGIGTPFLLWGVIYNTTGKNDFPYHMTMLILGIAFLILALIAGDIPVIRFKRKTTEINPVIPDDVIDLSWKLRWPLIIGGFATLIAIGVIGIIYLISGSWPLL